MLRINSRQELFLIQEPGRRSANKAKSGKIICKEGSKMEKKLQELDLDQMEKVSGGDFGRIAHDGIMVGPKCGRAYPTEAKLKEHLEKDHSQSVQG